MFGQNKKALKPLCFKTFRTGRGDRIWTCDLLVPNRRDSDYIIHVYSISLISLWGSRGLNKPLSSGVLLPFPLMGRGLYQLFVLLKNTIHFVWHPWLLQTLSTLNTSSNMFEATLKLLWHHFQTTSTLLWNIFEPQQKAECMHTPLNLFERKFKNNNLVRQND